MIRTPSRDIYIMIGEDLSIILTLNLDTNGMEIYASMVLSLYNPASKIDFDIEVLDPVDGTIRLSLPRSVTGTLKPKRRLFNVMVKDSANKVAPVLKGVAHIEASAVPVGDMI